MKNAVFRFLTHEEGKPRTYGVIVDQRHEPSFPDLGAIRELGAMANDYSGVCAFGKVAVLRRDGVYTYQVTQKGDSFPAYCGNSTAAAIASLGTDSEVIALFGPATTPYEVSPRIVGNSISQKWILPPGHVAGREWRGRRALFLRTLNHYAIVFDGLPEDVSPEDARKELLGPNIVGKLAVISGSENCRTVRFFNSNGEHGAAPQTGLAALALAARSPAWQGERIPGGGITCLVDKAPQLIRLPLICDVSSGLIELNMPTIDVVLDPSIRELTA